VTMDNVKPPNLVKIEDCLWVIEEQIGVPGYDFQFDGFFACKHPTYLSEALRVVARMGATNDYEKRYNELIQWNVRLIHDPDEYNLTSNLPNWYPRIREYTPKSIWFDSTPTQEEIEREFEWPVFLKGERQTSKHDRKKAIIETPDQFNEVMNLWKQDSILHWQRIVCRQYIPLKLVVDDNKLTMPKAFEFRTFWWENNCVGIGPYWASESYTLSTDQEVQIVNIGRKVAAAMNVTFLVIDLALTQGNEWIVIECNDGQDSGYAGVNPFSLWNNIIRILREI
jgi:ATP-grasp domain, R2K clade family 3